MIWSCIGALGGFLSVAMGAFGTHALRGALDATSMSIFQTAVTYQMYHSLALIFVGILQSQGVRVVYAGCSFATGLLIFCGSLYALVFTQLKWLGAIAPIGGVALMVGWLLLAKAAYFAARA